MNQKPKWIKSILKLHYLTEADYSAAATYGEALIKTETPLWREKFKEFHDDHCRHIRDLREVIHEEADHLKLPCEETQYFQEERAELESCESDEEIVRVLMKITEYAITLYGETMELDLPNPIPVVLQNGLTDVLRHQAWLKGILAKEEKPILLKPNPFLFFR